MTMHVCDLKIDAWILSPIIEERKVMSVALI